MRRLQGNTMEMIAAITMLYPEYTPRRKWTNRFRHHMKRIRKIDISSALTDGTDISQAEWINENEKKIAKNLLQQWVLEH